MAIKSITLLFLQFFISQSLYAAACCGGGSSLPSLITGDYRAQLSLAATNGAVTHDVNRDSAIKERNSNNQEVNEAMVLSGAYLINSLWQVGFSVPYKFNTHRSGNLSENSSGAGDIKVQMAYEFLPEYSYSLLKPRGFVFLEQTVPVSDSTYDANKPLRSDSLGNGFYSTALGVSFVKSIVQFDYLFMGEIHQSFKRSFEQNGENLSVTPKLGGSFLIGGGWSPNNGNLRLGTTLLHSRGGRRKIEGSINNISESTMFWEIGVSAAYLFNDDISLSLSYQDQTFLGTARNTTLSKIASLSLIKFFEL